MNQIKKNIELLAPAKNYEFGKIAINYGADAVYIGAPKFSARISASNSIEDISNLIIYAHKYFAKVYIALNTILFDDELEEASSIINNLYQQGADGVIIQDFGLLEMDLPPIPLIASTQMNNDNLEKIQFLEKVGFMRAILARELSLRQIEEIKKNTSIELECFVHGALCVSYSGQCYLSLAKNNRSANRGVCAQPCRLPYSLYDAKGKIIEQDKYLLSLKDLNLSNYLEQMIKIGITSFKIEGRLKDLDYVKNITSFYRQKIDNIIEDSNYQRASSGKTYHTFTPNIYKTFNRGYTDYFITKRNKDITSLNSPKNIGEYISKVISINKNNFTIETNEEINNGDGLCYFDSNNILCGTNVNTVKSGKIFSENMGKIKTGTKIFRNYDVKYSKLLKLDKTKRLIDVDMHVDELDNGFKLTIKDEDGVEASSTIKVEKNIAKDKNLASEFLKTHLSKLGNTIFTLKSLKVKWKNPYHINVASINLLKNNAVENLCKERMLKYQSINYARIGSSAKYPIENLDYKFNIANKKAERFYKKHGVKSILPAYEVASVDNAELMITKHCLRFTYGLCDGRSDVKDADHMILKHYNQEYILKFDCKNCKMIVNPISK